LAEPGVVAVSGVSDHGCTRNSIGDGLPDLFGGDERFGTEHHLFWHTGCAAPLGVFAPGFRHIEFVGDGEAGGGRADGEANGDLAVVLFADLAAVLPGNADGVLAFLREAGIVDDPGRDRRSRGHQGKDVLTNGLEEELVIPGRYGDDVMQGLMSAPDIVGVETGGHGFHAFAFSGQKEAEAVAG
jgi:hypothetical protein